MKARKNGGGKLLRSVVVAIRLDPKLRFAAELAARKQRRTVSSFIEWSIEQAVLSEVISKTTDDNGETALEAMMSIWDVEETDRFIKFAEKYPELLAFDEEHLLKLIKETPYFFRRVEQNPGKPFLIWSNSSDNISLERVRAHWELLNEIVAGKANKNALPKLPNSEISIPKECPY